MHNRTAASVAIAIVSTMATVADVGNPAPASDVFVEIRRPLPYTSSDGEPLRVWLDGEEGGREPDFVVRGAS